MQFYANNSIRSHSSSSRLYINPVWSKILKCKKTTSKRERIESYSRAKGYVTILRKSMLENISRSILSLMHALIKSLFNSSLKTDAFLSFESMACWGISINFSDFISLNSCVMRSENRFDESESSSLSKNPTHSWSDEKSIERYAIDYLNMTQLIDILIIISLQLCFDNNIFLPFSFIYSSLIWIREITTHETIVDKVENQIIISRAFELIMSQFPIVYIE